MMLFVGLFMSMFVVLGGGGRFVFVFMRRMFGFTVALVVRRLGFMVVFVVGRLGFVIVFVVGRP
jgi:hypothetical protein